MAKAPSDAVRRLIAAATERGIISASQHDALSQLQAEIEAAPVQAEAARGFNAVTVAYAIGALLVVFAAIWFLADRWHSLGPWGVLAVAAVYAGFLAGSSMWLEHHGFRQASSIALMLAVTLVPVAIWSLEVVTGLWPDGVESGWLNDSTQWASVCWLIVDLVTLLAALTAFSWRPGVALTIPLALMLWGLGLHLSRAVVGESLVGSLDRWLMLANGLLVCAVAGEIDRWQARARTQGRQGLDGGDLALFFWQIGLLAFAIGYMSLWTRAEAWRHLLVVVALILVMLSLLLNRRTHLVYGLLALFGYLTFLALDVFRRYLSLPLVLAILGVMLILTTVWVQRRFPRLVEKVNAERAGALLPPIVTRGPFILAFGIAMLSIVDVKEDRQKLAFARQLRIMQLHSGAARARYPRVVTVGRPLPSVGVP